MHAGRLADLEEVSPRILGAPELPRHAHSRTSTIVREHLLENLAMYNAREVVDVPRAIFKPNAGKCDCCGWLKTTVCAWHGRSIRHILPPWFLVVFQAVLVSFVCDRNIMQKYGLVLPDAIALREGYQLLAVPVSFLLVFRLNRAAVRYYDARAAFGKLIEIVRVFAGQAAEFCAHDTKARDDCCRWAVAFPVASRNYLRGEKPDAKKELSGILADYEVEAFEQAEVQPLMCLDRMRRAAGAGIRSNTCDSEMIAAQHLHHMEESIKILYSTFGAMERISNTPLPFAYVAHLRQMLLLYLLGMPWALQTSYGWGTGIIVGVVGFAMLGIEAAAVSCERPFGSNANHLPMEAFCKTVGKNVEQILSHAIEGQDQADLESCRLLEVEGRYRASE